MSGIVYDEERPFVPVVNDRLRTVLTNHSGQSDAHLSFPYLGILGEPMLEQYFLAEWLDSGEFERTISRMRNQKAL